MMRLKLINKVEGLRHEDLFMHMSMKECIVDIKLMHWPFPRESNGKNNPNDGRLDHKVECLMIVKTKVLVKALFYKVSLVSSNATIRISFDPKHTLTTNDVSLTLVRDQLSCIIIGESLEFFTHGISTFFVL